MKIGHVFGSLILMFLVGCTGIPEGIQPVNSFELERYLGKWYEIARLDHSFERGLQQVEANYSLREDGGVRVLNRGFNVEEGEWNSAEGKAFFVQDESTGYLKVSFFGPFYGSYVVFDLDQENYQYAYVCGPNRKFLWFLSRTPVVTEQERERFLSFAKKYDFDTEGIIWVDHKGD